MKHADTGKSSCCLWNKGFLGVALLLFVVAAAWSVVQPWMHPPKGVEPSKTLQLERIEGPWFEVVASKNVTEVKEKLSAVRLFVKFSGPDGERMMPFKDPNDPRFRIMLMGNTAEGQTKLLLDTKTHLIKDWQGGTVVIPCVASIPCAYHVIDYDDKDMVWMIVAGWDRDQVRVFSRAPGLPENLIDEIDTKLVALGYDLSALNYENKLPPIPKFAPAVPKVVPPLPKFDFGEKTLDPNKDKTDADDKK